MPHAAQKGIAQIVVLAAFCGASPSVLAQTMPDTENGRYTLTQQPDGTYVRLNTRNGQLATCSNASSGWECRVTPDERTALDAEIGRLQAENESLRSRLAQADAGKSNKNEDALPKSDPLAPSMPRSADGSRKIEIPLPSDRDVDRVMGFFEQVWRRLVEMAGRIQRDSSGKI